MPGPKPENIKGQKFGRLTALERTGKNKGRVSIWECVCECGNKHTAIISQLKNGDVKSCGCLKKAETPVTSERLFNIWQGMRQRCKNVNNKAYPLYGGRGISVCPEWEDYKVFRKWSLENGYKENLTLDRVDNNKSYSPGNCRWATMAEQNRNKRNNIYVEYKGETITLGELAQKTGLSLPMIHRRYKAGYRGEKLWSNIHFQTNNHVKIDIEDGSSRQK